MPNDHKPAEPGPGQAGRRAFLTLAGVVAAAVPVSSFLAACESGRSPGGTAAPAGRSAGSTVAAPCAPSPCAGLGAGTAPALTDWHTLRRSLSTKELIQPGQGGYTTARELFDPRFDAIEPAGIAYCRTPQDVSACLAFVRRFGLPVAARSGGHSYGGWSSSTGLVVDVTQMNAFQVAAGGNTVQVGTGTRLVDFYNGLAAHGLAVLTGGPGGGGVAILGAVHAGRTLVQPAPDRVATRPAAYRAGRRHVPGQRRRGRGPAEQALRRRRRPAGQPVRGRDLVPERDDGGGGLRGLQRLAVPSAHADGGRQALPRALVCQI